MIVYSATARLVALVLKNHGDGDFIARGALWSNTCSIYDQRYKCHNLRDGGRRPPATMFTTPGRLQRQQQAYRLRIAIFFLPHLHSTPQLGGFPLEYRHPAWYGKTRMIWLPDGEKISKISLFVLTQLTTVTDTQTHTQSHRHRMTA